MKKRFEATDCSQPGQDTCNFAYDETFTTQPYGKNRSVHLQRPCLYLPKVKGIPMASQLRPITLLNTDYKLLTKVFVARLMRLLPSFLQRAQLCSVRGRTIMQGAISLWSTAEFIHQRRRGFMLNLDFYHAYDRVCLPYVDKVLEGMGFGQLFQGVVATLHRGATASFLLHHVTSAVPITFLVRQGDPIAMLLYIIQLQPFLLRLEEVLPGVAFPDFEERVEAYVGDVVVVGEDENDLLIVDAVCRQFEAISGAILNRSHKTAILGLGWQEGLASCLGQCPGPAQDIWGGFCPNYGLHGHPVLGGLPGWCPGGHLWLEGHGGALPEREEGRSGGVRLQQALVPCPDSPLTPGRGHEGHQPGRVFPLGWPP
jgi:hypothetical protein